MPNTTPIYSWPIPTLTDSPNAPQQISDLADAVETTISGHGVSPVGDAATYSMFLTGSDIAFTANDNKNILTTGAITFTRSQWVILAGNVRATNSGGNIGFFGAYIDVDSTLYPQLQSGVLGLGTTSPTDRRQFTIPAFSVLVAAGTHTFRLRGDRDSAVTTISAQAADALNQSYHPTSLTVII